MKNLIVAWVVLGTLVVWTMAVNKQNTKIKLFDIFSWAKKIEQRENDSIWDM